MHGPHLFLIPIYFRSLEKHASDMEKRKTKFVKDMMSMRHHLNNKEYEETFDRDYWMPWEYSQVVGYVEMCISPFGDLKAYYWFVKAKRISSKMNNREMKYAGKLFDVSKLNKSNETIRSDIRHFISVLPSLRERFKGRYFDSRPLEMVLDAIDFSLIVHQRKGS
ncbi:MAG: hypothetical protein ACYDC8_00805 [Gammaproteobacteria bacterium]